MKQYNQINQTNQILQDNIKSIFGGEKGNIH